ncbi:MAG: alpha/beta hydrolase [Solirubrobacterales bacterium]|nr:alpha/beta hydrolase [Solirubrobacterales bacterium]
MAAEETSGTIDVGGRTLAWRGLGAGPPLLLINGYAATAADWDPTFLAALAERFEVVCPDNRGVGGSDLGDPDALTVAGMAADAVALLDALGHERATVAGWSMGGFVAQRLALDAPERVGALALLSTDPGHGRAVLADAEVWRRLTDDSGSPREQATRLIGLLFPPELAARIDALFGDVVAAARAALPAATLRAQEAAMTAWQGATAEPLPQPPPRVLAACGDADVVIPPANLERLAERWPGTRTELFAGGGHAFMAQEPARLAALIAGFAAG